MKANHLILALVALIAACATLIALRFRIEIAPPEAVKYVGAVGHIEGRKMRVWLRADRPAPCVPISMQFVQASDGTVLRIPGIREAKGASVIYDLVLPDNLRDGEAVFWVNERFQCGSYRPVTTPRVAFWVGKIESR